MTRETRQEWERYAANRAAFPEAAERGRLLAAARMADDAEARKRVEDAYGVDFCRQMYPEAYKKGAIRLIDKVWKLIPWF